MEPHSRSMSHPQRPAKTPRRSGIEVDPLARCIARGADQRGVVSSASQLQPPKLRSS